MPPAAVALQRLQVPVWVASGRSGSSLEGDGGGEAERTGRAILDRLPHGSQVEVFSDSQALPHVEQAVAWSQALTRFVDSLPA